MANFIAVVDPDPARRAAFLARAAERLAIVPGLRLGQLEQGRVAVAWAAGARAPLSRVDAPDGGALLFGDALRGGAAGATGAARLDATALRTAWRAPARALPPPLDGYHAGLAWQPDGTLTCGVDLLGWFPLYWHARDDVLLVGSSPELLAEHPVCDAALDPAALAGTLLLNGVVLDRPLLAPLRRLAVGHLLHWTPEGGPCELPQYALAAEWHGEDLPRPAYEERLDAALADAMRRHVGDDGTVGLLLSGGLDSRMLAGYLHRQGTRVVALTQGLPSDLEMRCAARVARTLEFEHRGHEVPMERLPEYAMRTATWEHLAGGFASVLSWGRETALGALPPRVVAGYGFDHALHANSITPPPALRSGTLPFATALEVRRKYGFAPELLARLLRPDGGAACLDEVLAALDDAYRRTAASDFRRYWIFSLVERARNHIGITAWRSSFAAWPVLPLLDRALLDTIGAMPVAALSGRRLQTELMLTRFPALAALPLDSGNRFGASLAPGLAEQLRARLRGRLAPVRRRIEPLLRDPRYYRRTYDFNGPGWRLVRAMADGHRERAGELFDRRVLDEVLPPASATVEVVPGKPHTNGLKLLTGVVLWHARHA